LIIGIRDDKGTPNEVSGFELGTETQEQYQLRIVEILQSRIKPRVQGVGIRCFQLQNGKWAAVIRIPKSFAAPHQVEIGSKDFQFWFRHTGGKQRMDVDEIRSTILASESLAERIRNFRIERLGRIVSQETPIPLINGPKIVMHLIPLNAFNVSSRYDLSPMQNQIKLLDPIYAHFHNGPRYNFEGLLAHNKYSDQPVAGSYVQLLLNGIVESVEGALFSFAPGPSNLDMWRIEGMIIDALQRYLTIQNRLGVSPPVLVMLSLLDIQGYTIEAPRHSTYFNPQPGIGEKNLLIPEEEIEAFDRPADQLLRPIFDRIWNAAGWPRCLYYANNGTRIGQ
jgi:hypothetical protein